MQEIKIELTKTPKQKPQDQSKLGFGKIFTDHMYVMPYNKEQGWHDPKIVPYQPITLEPSAMVFHYGQEMFEGLKAYKTEDGRVLLFRPDKNIARANHSNDRLCIPEIPADDFLNALKTLVKVDKDWIPTQPGITAKIVLPTPIFPFPTSGYFSWIAAITGFSSSRASRGHVPASMAFCAFCTSFARPTYAGSFLESANSASPSGLER